ncbi:MAG: hypothetical protein Q8T03_07435 [Bacteroidota bacterium]|nr:hypothetical protein [Bacteroidota bacterium]
MKTIFISLVLLTSISCQSQVKKEDSNIKNQSNKKEVSMNTRDILMQQIANGYDTVGVTNNEGKSILARGCDPEMGKRSSEILPKLLGNPEMVSVYNDIDFINQLKSKKWSVIFFAPGACRYDANNMNIPGSGGETEGWGLKDYREMAIKYQGKDIQIVETLDESQIIELLRNALNVQ